MKINHPSSWCHSEMGHGLPGRKNAALSQAMLVLSFVSSSSRLSMSDKPAINIYSKMIHTSLEQYFCKTGKLLTGCCYLSVLHNNMRRSAKQFRFIFMHEQLLWNLGMGNFGYMHDRINKLLVYAKSQ